MRTKTIRGALAICMAIATTTVVKAQTENYNGFIEPAGFSLGANGGITDLWGDVGTKSVIDHYKYHYTDDIKYMGGMFAKYTFHPCFAVRLQGNYGTLYATDKWNTDLAKKATNLNADAVQRYLRDQDIKDHITEASLIFEFSPFRLTSDFKIAYKVGQPYILAGVSYFHYTPYSTYNNSGRFIAIKDLHLEGDGWGAGYPAAIKYSQFAIPVGLGYRWDIGLHMNLGIEYMYRFTFTDYLDGVSGKYVSASEFNANLKGGDEVTAYQMSDKRYLSDKYGDYIPAGTPGYRGNPNNKDGYSTLSIIIYYKVKNRTRPWWGDWFY